MLTQLLSIVTIFNKSNYTYINNIYYYLANEIK